MTKEYMVEAQSGANIPVKSGSKIEIIDLKGQQVVDFFATNQTNAQEYLSAGATIDCNESLKISTEA